MTNPRLTWPRLTPGVSAQRNVRPGEGFAGHNFLYFLLPALFIALPAVTLASAESQSNQPRRIENPARIDSAARNNIFPDTKLSKPKDVPLKTILPEGYPISGRRAKLVKDTIHNRWFLVFAEALELYAPEVAAKNAVKSEKTAIALRKKTQETDQNAVKSVKKVIPTDSGKIPGSENPFCHPIEVLPGKRLTAMTNSIGNQADQSLDFRIWGEVTAYQGVLNDYHNRNYILLTVVGTLQLFGPEAVENAKTSKTINPLDAAFGQPKTTGPENSKQRQNSDKSKIPKKLRDALSSIPRTRPLELPDVRQSPTRPQPRVAIPHKTDGKKTSQQNDWQDGYMVIDRVGRIHFDPEGMRWLFTFEADGASLSEPPVTLHPCRLLEIMENAVDRSSESLRFRISGQISQYQGRNYLLLRKVLMVYDLGNLGK